MINQGNYRQNIFNGEGAAEAFERALDEAARRYAWRIHAYVVMRNHFHLAVELAEPNLSEGMKWLQGTWIRRFNGFRGWIGRPFQGRYKALLAEPGRSFASANQKASRQDIGQGKRKTAFRRALSDIKA